MKIFLSLDELLGLDGMTRGPAAALKRLQGARKEGMIRKGRSIAHYDFDDLPEKTQKDIKWRIHSFFRKMEKK